MGSRPPPGPAWLTSADELMSDLGDLRTLARAICNSVVRRAREVAACTMIHPATRGEQVHLLRGLATTLEAQSRELTLTMRDARKNDFNLLRLQAAKESHASLLRSRLAAASGLAVASDWNSPSIDHSLISNAGRESGAITSFLDDYKRDRHRLAADYEQAWLREYVEAPKADLRALVTSCGMTAFVTIASMIRIEDGSGPVLVGRATYHECRDLLEEGIAGRDVIMIDESDPDQVLAAIRAVAPSAIFLDSLGNNATITFPDLEGILRRLSAARYRGAVVIDNTGRSLSAQPWGIESTSRLRMIVFESVTKYPQLGFDRTTAGMIVCSSIDGAVLDDLREHLGTNITDTAVTQLPPPNRVILLRRLIRIDRNATALASALELHSRRHNLPLSVHHPSLRDHPSHDVVRALSFRGGSFAIELDSRIDGHRARSRLVDLFLEEAKLAMVPLIHGTSFGFDTSRVYLTAAHAEHGTPFVRISAGTEHAGQIASVASALQIAATRLVTELPINPSRGTSTTRSASRREPASAHPR